MNCSLFNPTPSLSAMIINHFKMRSNVVSYNLSGMGCSAGVIAISLARELLQVCPALRLSLPGRGHDSTNGCGRNDGPSFLLHGSFACPVQVYNVRG